MAGLFYHISRVIFDKQFPLLESAILPDFGKNETFLLSLARRFCSLCSLSEVFGCLGKRHYRTLHTIDMYYIASACF